MQNIKVIIKELLLLWLLCHIVLLKSLCSFGFVFFLISSIAISLVIQRHAWFNSRNIHVYLLYIKAIYGTLDPPALAMYSLRISLGVIIEQEVHMP